MRLNPDCVRDILMSVEELSTVDTVVRIDKNNYKKFDALKKYDYDVVNYHIRQCAMLNYFYRYSQSLSGTHNIPDLTPEAHDFLENIRSQSFWNKVKTKAAEAGISSLQALMQIAKTLAAAQIESMLK